MYQIFELVHGGRSHGSKYYPVRKGLFSTLEEAQANLKYYPNSKIKNLTTGKWVK